MTTSGSCHSNKWGRQIVRELVCMQADCSGMRIQQMQCCYGACLWFCKFVVSLTSQGLGRSAHLRLRQSSRPYLQPLNIAHITVTSNTEAQFHTDPCTHLSNRLMLMLYKQENLHGVVQASQSEGGISTRGIYADQRRNAATWRGWY